MNYPPAYLAAVAFTLPFEGGYVNDPDDAGGETNRGITDKADGTVDHMVDMDRNGTGDIAIKAITEADAIAYYYRWYWQGVCEGLPPIYSALLFDCSVNHGFARAKRWKLEYPTLKELLVAREDFYHACVQARPRNQKYIKGWLNRIDGFCKKFNLKYRTTR